MSIWKITAIQIGSILIFLMKHNLLNLIMLGKSFINLCYLINCFIHLYRIEVLIPDGLKVKTS